jgi:RNA polymerase sigma factor (sigma-70 family)
MEPSGKLALFEEVIVPHMNSAYNLARWLTRNDADARDVVQEAYLRAFRFFDAFQGIDGRAWLLAIVRNTCSSWRRREAGESAAVAFDERMHGADREVRSVETDLVEGEKMRSLRDCIEALPSEYREAIVMRELEEMSYREMADATGVPMGTVMSRLSRARVRLQDCVRGAAGGSR